MHGGNAVRADHRKFYRLAVIASGLAAIALAVLIGSLLLLLTRERADVESGPGTALRRDLAPDFRLMDQSGAAVALSDFRGKPVVLTFLYTACPDFCPLTASKLRQMLEGLGGGAADVAVLAVSVDPKRDDQAAAYEFSSRHRLLGYNWHYLTGSEAELTQVWRSYGIGQDYMAAPGLGPPAEGVVHTDALYVIDAQGHKRTLLRSDFDPAWLAAYLRELAK